MTEMYEKSAESLRVSVHNYEYDDPYVDGDFDAINGMATAMARVGSEYYIGEGLDPISRKRKSSIDLVGNPATRMFVSEFPDMGKWMSMVPTAAALHPLYAPEERKFANGEEYDEHTAAWFKNVADARGIRSRAKIMQDVLIDHVRDTDGTAQQWLSLASGAAQPMFATLNQIAQEGEYPLPFVTLADKDKSALGLAKGYATGHGLESQIDTRNLNVLARRGLSYSRGEGVAGTVGAAVMRARGKLLEESYDAVDAVGIFEYLNRPDWKYTYDKVVKTSTKLAGAETFLKNAYQLVKPGGTLVIGNMLDTHPQLEFTLNVIQWPHIQPRSIDEMIDIAKSVGIEGEIDVYIPEDGVYAIYAFRKPE